MSMIHLCFIIVSTINVRHSESEGGESFNCHMNRFRNTNLKGVFYFRSCNSYRYTPMKGWGTLNY